MTNHRQGRLLFHLSTGSLARRIAFGVTAAALLACGEPSAEPRLEKVTLSSTRWLSSAVEHIALDRGFFEDEGLDVEVVMMHRAGAALPALSQGDLDVAVTGPLNPRYFNIIQRGGRLRLVAARAVHATDACAYAGIVARTDLLQSGRLDDFESLRGLIISTERTSSNYYVWSRLLRDAGLTLGEVELRDIPTVAKIDAFAKGLIDASTVSEPWVTRLVATGDTRVWRKMADVLPDHQSTFLLFGKRLLDERRDLGRRFLAAYQRAARVYNEEGKSERHIEIVARRTQFDRQELEAMCWPPWSKDGRVDARTLSEYQEWALAEGLIDEVVPFETLVDEAFLDEIDQARMASGG
jgi:NitT/TauT family transport system substrate-binding protein